MRERRLRLVPQLVAVDADLEALPVVDEASAVAIEDVAAQGVGRHRPQRVVACVPFVLGSRQDLEEPQPRREGHEHERHDEREDLQPGARTLHLEAHHPAGVRRGGRTPQHRIEDRREHRAVEGREDHDLRDVAEGAFLLAEEERHDLWKATPPAVPTATRNAGSRGDGDVMYCRARPIVYPSIVRVRAVIPFGVLSRKSCDRPLTNPTTAPSAGPSERREHDGHQVEQLRLHPEERELGEHRRLQQERGDDHGHEDHGPSHGAPSAAARRRAITRTFCSVEKSTAGRIVTKDSTEPASLNARETVPIRMPGG